MGRVEVRMVFLLETDLLTVRADEGGTYARLVRTGRLDLILTIPFFPMEGFDVHIQFCRETGSQVLVLGSNQLIVGQSSRSLCVIAMLRSTSKYARR